MLTPCQTVRIPTGRVVSLRSYVYAWRALLSMDGATRVTDWSWSGDTAADVLRDMRSGLHDRINLHLAGYGKGRKWSSDWQRAVGQCARRVNTPRLIVRAPEVPPDLRARLAHRIYEE
jgi:hypothetical protein